MNKTIRMKNDTRSELSNISTTLQWARFRRYGFGVVNQFLEGGHAMDDHFQKDTRGAAANVDQLGKHMKVHGYCNIYSQYSFESM